MTYKKLFNMKILLYIVIILFSINLGFAQVLKNKQIYFGYGFYEAINIGMKHIIDQHNIIGLSIGSNFHLLNNEKYYAIELEYDRSIFNNNNKINNWFFINKIIYWNLEDKYYLWKVLSWSPCLGKYIYFTDKIGSLIDIGPLFNLVLYNKRKTFEEVGWPYKIMPNFRIELFYNIK